MRRSGLVRARTAVELRQGKQTWSMRAPRTSVSPFDGARARRLTRLLALVLGLASVAAVAAAPKPAAADSPFCQAVQARASADASLLMWPQVVVQALRFPDLLQRWTEPAAGQNQARAGLAYSLIDLYKGIGVLSIAEAECEAHRAQVNIEEILLMGDDVGRLPALRAQVAYLETHRDAWRAIVAKEEDRFARRVITLSELTEVRLRANSLERGLVRSIAEADRLASTGLKRPNTTIDTLSSRYLARADRVEQRVSHLRGLASWQFRLSGGAAVTAAHPSDWYALIELSFNLGAFGERHHDAHYLRARREEMQSDRTALIGRLLALRTRMRGARSQAKSELATIDRHLSLVAEARRALESAEPASAAHAASLLAFDEISVEAERTYLSTLVDELSSLLKEPHG